MDEQEKKRVFQTLSGGGTRNDNFYVYALCSGNVPFYIGKGRGERILNHETCALMAKESIEADDTLSVAAKSISEIITVKGIINLDFRDVETTLKDGGVAIMSTGYGEGEGRVGKAIEDALNSPLLNDNDVFNSKKILLSIAFSGKKEDSDMLTMEEMNDVNDFMAKFGADFDFKWGLSTDPDLGNKVKVTLLATGFGIKDVEGMSEHIGKHAQEEAIARAQKEEKDAERLERMKTYYGDGSFTAKYKHSPKIYLFKPEDLDNEDVISIVENNPTFRRSSQQLKEIQAISTGTGDKVDTSSDTPGTISFD